MVAIITGKGTGLERSSAFVLGSRGQLGSAPLGRDGEGVFVNAANGNLVITRQDEFLIGLGPDAGTGLSYNSQGNFSDDNGDNWQASPAKAIWSAGGVNVAGATVTRRDWDGSETVFAYDVPLGKYVSKEGKGAYDTIVYNGQWHWVDGDTQVDEYYSAADGYKITTRTDTDGNKLTYTYPGGNLRITTEKGDYTELVYSGTLLQQVTTYAPGPSPSLTRVFYEYDGSNRLATVKINLDPTDLSKTTGANYVTTYTYDGASKRVASIAQADGSLVSFTYVLDGADYKIASYTQTVAAGVTRMTTFAYDSAAGRTTVTDPAGQKTILFYDANGNLTQISYPADSGAVTPKVVQFAYDGDGDVITAALGPGNVITYDYDPRGNLILERDSAGNTITRTYSNPKNELLTETRYVAPDPDGAGAGPPTTPQTTRFVYDASSNLRFIVSAEGLVSEYEYITTPGAIGFGQLKAAIEYTAQGYDVSALGPQDLISLATLTGWAANVSDKSTTRRTETSYDYRGAVATVKSYSKVLASGQFDTGSELSQTTYTYDSYGSLLTRTVNGSAASEVFVHDGLGRTTIATDFNGNVTRTSFLDSLGQTVLTHANGLSQVSTYNRAGELISSSTSSAGGNLVDVSGWPSNPDNVPSGQATLPGWMNPINFTDETRWAATLGPDGLPVVAMQAGQLDMSEEGGGQYTHEITIDATKAYEFTYHFKLSAMDKHYVFFGLSGGAPAYVENLNDGADNGNPYFWYASPGMQDAYLDPDKWYKVVAYVLPQGTALSSAPLGGVYDVATGQKVLDLHLNFRWNPERAGNTVHSRFFDYYGQADLLDYSTYFYQPEVRQVTTPAVTAPDTATSLYRYDNLGRLRMTVDPTGRRNYMMYDSLGRKVADVDSDGSIIEYRYDGNDNLTSTTRYANKLTPAQLLQLTDFDAGGGGFGAVGSSLLTNGSFDTSGSYTTLATGRSNVDLPGWSRTNAEYFEQVASGQMGVTGTDGAYWLDLDSVAGTGTIPTGPNLLTNGSFDASGSYTSLATGRSNSTLPGWSRANAENFEQVASGQMGVTGTDGAYWLDMDSVAGTGYETVGSNLLTNGSFDTSGTYTSIATGRSNISLPGWTKTNSENFEQVTSGQMGVTGTNGSYWLDMESVVGGGIVPTGPNLLVNGSFDTSAASYTTPAQGRASTTLPGWTKTNQIGNFEQVTTGYYGVAGTDGAYWLDLDGYSTIMGENVPTNMDIRQTVSGLTAGQTMILQFDHANRTSAASGSFEVYWNTTLIATINSTGVTMLNKTYQVTALAGDNVLRFKGTGTANQVGASIDNVRLFATTSAGGGGNMDISQTVGGLTAGQLLQLQFDHANRTTAASGSFEVYWNGTLIATITDTGATMQTKTYQVNAVAGNNTLRFKALGTVDAAGASLDNVRLFAMQPVVGGGNMDISQTVGGLTAGQVMQLQFDHANRTGNSSGQFQVYWNGALVATVTDTSAVMQTKTYSLTAVAGNNVLRFKSLGAVDAAGASLDNVRLFATTTPVGGGNMDVSQTVSGLTAGQTMMLQFNHANRTTAASGSFEVYWNGVLVAAIAESGAAMQTKTFQVVAAGGNNILRFKGTGTVDANGASIDNVRLFATAANVGATGLKLADVRPIASANDAWTFQVYDNAQRLVQTIDGTGATAVLKYDGASRLVSTTQYANRLSAATLASLQAEAINPNHWANAGDGTLWAYYNLAQAAASPIDGSNAYQFTIQDSSWAAVVGTPMANVAGDTISVTISMKAVGATTSNSFGLYGTITGWGDYGNPDARGTIVSGPGTVTQSGSYFHIQGLSTTEATRFTIIRTLSVADTTQPYLYVRTGATFDGAAGASTILAAPVVSRLHAGPYHLPAADAANDRVARQFYDRDGRLIGALDGEGHLTETSYDKSGQKIRSVAYAAATTAGLRAAGTFAQLRANAIENGSANLWTTPNDAAGWAGWGLQAPEAAGQIDGHNAFKLTIAQAGAGGGLYGWTSAVTPGEITNIALSVKAVGAQTSITFGTAQYDGQWGWGPDDYSTVQIVSGPGIVSRVVGAAWTVSGLSATEATRIIVTKKAAAAQDEYPHIYIGYYTQEAGAALILSNPVFTRGNPADIETNYVYDARGMLRATVDGEGGLTRYRYTPLGEVDEEIRGQKLNAADRPLVGLKFATLPAAPGGAILETTSFTRNLYGQVLTETKSLTGSTTTTTTYAYDNMRRLVSTVTQSGGVDPRTYGQRYDLRGRVTSELSGVGNAALALNPGNIEQIYIDYGWTYAYDSAGRMISKTGPRGAAAAGARTLYYYNADGALSYEVGALGEVVEYRYDSFGARTDTIVYANPITNLSGMAGGSDVSLVVARLTPNPAADSTVHVDYNVTGTVKQSSDPHGNVTTYAYDAFGALISQLTPLDGATTILTERSYDRRGLLKQDRVDPAGINIVTTYGYDAFGRAITLTNALGKVTTSTFDRAGRLRTQSLSPDSGVTVYTTTFSYDARGNLVAVTDAAGKVTRYVYDKANRKIAAIDALGGVTTTTYDADGRVIATRAWFNTVSIGALPLEVTEAALALPGAHAADHITRYAYDKDGQLRFELDGLGHVTEHVNDAKGNVVRTIAYDGTIVATPPGGVYSASWFEGQVTSLAVLAGTRITRSVYDALNRLNYVVDALGQVTFFAYDARGKLIKQVEFATLYTTPGDPLVGAMDTWSATYANPAGDRTTRAFYDRKGQLKYSIDAGNFVTLFDYDKLGNMKGQTRFADAYAASDATTIANLDANFASPPATRRFTQFLYDAAGRMIETIDPEGYRTTLVLDKLGQVIQSTAANGTSAASVTTYAYDDVGRLTTETGGYGEAQPSTSYSFYDAMGRMTASVDAGNYLAVWTYDANGRALTETHYGNAITGAFTVNTSVAALQALAGTSATDAATAAAYDAFGRTTSTTDARGSIVSNTYDAIDQLLTSTEQLEAGATDDRVTTYSYDHFGSVVKVRDARENDSFAYYDKLGRVLRQVDAEKFVTDTTYTRGGQVATTRRWANYLTVAVTEAAFPANPIADPARDATTTFVYNNCDEIVSVLDAAGFTESYTLNAFGERIQVRNKLHGSVVGGVTLDTTVHYTFDKRGLVLSETLPITTKTAGGATIAVVNKYEYDARGNRTRLIEAFDAAEVRTTNYAYDKLDRLVTTTHDAVTIVNNDLTSTANFTPYETNKYDRQGNLIESIDAGGARTLAWYDGFGRRIAEANSVGTVTRWAYDANGNVVSTRIFATAITLPADATGPAPSPGGAYRETIFAHDRANRLIAATVANLLTGEWNGTGYALATGNIVTSSDYDKAGNVIHQDDGRGSDIYSWYDRLGREIARVDAENYLTVWSRDAEGNVLTETRYATQLSSFTPGSAPPTVAASAADRTTSFEYDRAGRRTKEQRLAVGYTIIDTLSGAATDVAATDVSARSTVTYTYNGLGEILSRTDAASATAYTHDTIGRVTLETGQSFTDYQDASVTPRIAYSYDGLNNVKSTRVQMDAAANDTNDRITTYTYGAGGRLATMTDAANFTRTYGHDAAGRVVRDSYARLKSDGTSITEAQITRYDIAGRAIIQTSARFNGAAWVFTDAAGAAYDAVRIRYNAFGEISGRGLTAGPNAAEAYQEIFEFDGGGRLWKSTQGDGVLRFHVYDKAGNQTLTLASTGADLSGLTLLNYTGSIQPTGDTNLSGAVTSIAVFDKRGQQTQTREPDRQLSSVVTTEIVRASAYNAFGEVTSETDGRGYATSFTYNNMGRLLSRVSPQVNFTAEHGGISTANPTENYGYDLAGRMVSVSDANGNRITRLLLAGSGQGDGEALVTKEFHPDTGVAQTKYDVFGDARISINEIGGTETRVFDKLGRLTAQYHPVRAAGSWGNPGGSAVQLIDYFGYDGLGQRTQHWNSQLTSAVKETTDYDVQGRVVSTVAFGGDSTTTTYLWDASFVTAGLGAFGGRTKTMVNSAALTMTEKLDYFGRTIDQIDFGGHNYDFTFDTGGRLVARTNLSGESIAYSYYSSGQIAGQTGTQGIAGYEYDAAGNRTKETFSKNAVSYRNATAAYDALGRMTNWSDAGLGGAIPASTAWEYDKVGNVRYVQSSYRTLDLQGNVAATNSTQSEWYLYDSMNRFTLTKGVLNGARGSGTIEIGETGSQIAYYLDGNRRSALYAANVLGSRWAYMSGGGPWGGPGFEIFPDGSGQDGTWTSVPFNFQGLRREDYFYSADGYLAATNKADSWMDPGPQPGQYDQSPPEPTYYDPPATGGYLSRTTLDGMGRTIYYKEYGGIDGSFERSNIVYDNAGRQLSETTITIRADAGGGPWHTYTTYLTNTYGGPGGALSQQLQDTYRNGTDSGVPDSRQTYGYVWWDGALQGTIGNDNDNNGTIDWWTTYNYDSSGHVSTVGIADGRPRTVTFATDQNGMIVDRDEVDNLPGGDPRKLHYFFSGLEFGQVGNDGTANMQYVASIHSRLAPVSGPNGAFQGGATYSTPYADFAQSYDAINGFNNAGTSSTYTVNDGDTLATIAQNVWGDSLLWYLIAQANGLSGGAPLVAGQVLTIPNKVHNNRNSADTWHVYNPNEAIGDTSPTAIKPPKKAAKCGVIGTILVALVAVAVSIALPHLSAFFAKGAGLIIGGMISSVVSQGVGIATGVQQKFDWKGVALAGITAGVGVGLGKLPGVGAFMRADTLVSNVVRGAASSAISQGIGVATGLQSKFSWAGVAAAGVAAGVSGAIGRAMSRSMTMPGVDGQPGETVRTATLGGRIVGGAAGTIAAATTRSIATGTSFGDNILAVLPDIIASTLGAVAEDAIATHARNAIIERAIAQTRPDLSREQIKTMRRDWDVRTAGIEANLPVADRENWLFYMTDSRVPAEIRRQVWADYQAGRIKPDYVVAPLGGSTMTYDRSIGEFGTITVDEATWGARDNPQTGIFTRAILGFAHMSEIGHMLEAVTMERAKLQGEFAGDEGSMFAYLEARRLANIGGYVTQTFGSLGSLTISSTLMGATADFEMNTGRLFRENRVGGVEHYGLAGHYHTTFLVTYGVMRAATPGREDAAYAMASELALGSQIPDMFRHLTAYEARMDQIWNGLRWDEMADIQNALHSLFPESWNAGPRAVAANQRWSAEQVVNALRQGNYTLAGLRIHRLGDSYAHTYEENGEVRGHKVPNGHGELNLSDNGHRFDDMYWRLPLAHDYVKALSLSIADGLYGTRFPRARINQIAQFGTIDWRDTIFSSRRTGGERSFLTAAERLEGDYLVAARAAQRRYRSTYSIPEVRTDRSYLEPGSPHIGQPPGNYQRELNVLLPRSTNTWRTRGR